MLSPLCRYRVCKKRQVPCSLLISLIAPSSRLPPEPVQMRSRRALQSCPRVPVVALSQLLMQPLPPHLTDPPTPSQPRLSPQPMPLPRHQLLSTRHLRLLPSKNPQQPSHRLHSRPSRQFGSLAILLLLRRSQRPTLLRRKAEHEEHVAICFADTSFRKSPQSKPTRPRSPTRPIKVSSHLTAPTAASAARQDTQPPRASMSVSKPAVVNRPQARASAPTTKPAVRPSAASASSAPKKAETRPAATSKGPDDGFLARMMRPTASSASKVQDKTEVKSPPKRTPSVIRSKTSVKPRTTKAEKPKSSSSAEKEELAAGASTPQAASGDQERGNAELEATPAFDAATIR